MATYDDFLRISKDYGIESEFSPYDLELAQKNPDAGIKLAEAKYGYKTATDDNGRMLYNIEAEGVRKAYGGYTGGKWGIENNKIDTPSSFVSPVGNDVSSFYDAYTGTSPYQDNTPKPAYTGTYDAQYNDLLNAYVNREGFNGDVESSPLYGSYKKSYQREGQRATADALGMASAATGGIPSSYAVSAATQAGDYYAAQMADKVPEIYEILYQQYLSDLNVDKSKLNAVGTARDADWGRYLDSLGQYNTDRNFDYNTWAGNTDLAAGKFDAATKRENAAYEKFYNDITYKNDLENEAYDRYYKGTQLRQQADDSAYNKSRDAIEDERYADETNYNRGIYADETAYGRAQDKWKHAAEAAAVGDFSLYRELGVDPSSYETAYKKAQTDAAFEKRLSQAMDIYEITGDPSRLEALGVSVQLDVLGGTGSGSSGGKGSYTAEQVLRDMRTAGCTTEQLQEALEQMRLGASPESVAITYNLDVPATETAAPVDTTAWDNRPELKDGDTTHGIKALWTSAESADAFIKTLVLEVDTGRIKKKDAELFLARTDISEYLEISEKTEG